jgi:hypothetical protein
VQCGISFPKRRIRERKRGENERRGEERFPGTWCEGGGGGGDPNRILHLGLEAKYFVHWNAISLRKISLSFKHKSASVT